MGKLKILFCTFFIGAILVSSYGQAPTKKKDTVAVNQLVDSLAAVLNRNYIFPEKALLITAHLKSELKKGNYNKLNDERQLAQKLVADMQGVHQDHHLRLYYSPKLENRLLKPREIKKQSIDTVALLKAKEKNFSFKRLEILNGNIGYVRFDEFHDLVEDAKPTLNAAFRFLSNTSSIVIDLRSNGGGSPQMVKQIASYFVIERTRLNDIYNRSQDTTVVFLADPSLAENMKLSMPVLILTSKRTFSGAEDFAYAMQVNKRAIIVGETTRGGAHLTRPFSIGQGFIVDIPFARSINHITKTDWEGIGVVPDISVPADRALIKAQEIVLDKQLSEAKTEKRKMQVLWSMRALKVHDYDESISSDLLLSYVGSYTPFSIFLKEDLVYLKDPGGRIFLLKPITNKLFLANDWLQVEFIFGEDKKVSKLKLMGKPGWDDFHEKVN